MGACLFTICRYYNDGGISSVYCWDIEDIDDDDDDNVSGISDAGLEHFACAVLLKKGMLVDLRASSYILLSGPSRKFERYLGFHSHI